MDRAALLRDVKKCGTRAVGRKEYLLYLQNKIVRAAWKTRIRAMCYYCTGYYADGKEDCGIEECPLYPTMPYNKAATIKK